MEGTVLMYDRVRGFGFIGPDDDQDDLFVHYSNIESTPRFLKVGQRVVFENGAYKNKPTALHVAAVAANTTARKGEGGGQCL